MHARGNEERDTEPGWGRRTLLVVDDDAQTRWTLAELLASEYDVVQAEDGEEALNIARSRKVHLILLDVRMPNLDGHQTCALLKARRETAKIPVIFLTGNREPSQEVRALRLGAIDYLTKPFNLSVLRARISRHMPWGRD